MPCAAAALLRRRDRGVVISEAPFSSASQATAKSQACSRVRGARAERQLTSGSQLAPLVVSARALAGARAGHVTQAAHGTASAAAAAGVCRVLVVDPSGESSWIDPDTMDIQLSDVDEAKLKTAVAELLGVGYLTRAEPAARFPVRGAVYGRLERLMVNLVVQRPATGLCLNVIFLVDTGSAFTYLTPLAFEALGFADSVPSTAVLSVHGVALTVSPSRAHFCDANVLGQDFFRDGRVDLLVQHSRADKPAWLRRPVRRGR